MEDNIKMNFSETNCVHMSLFSWLILCAVESFGISVEPTAFKPRHLVQGFYWSLDSHSSVHEKYNVLGCNTV